MGNQATHASETASDSLAIAALQHGKWRGFSRLSSVILASLARVERFLAEAGFDRPPWLAVAFAGGIGLWFMLDNRWQWLAVIAVGLATALAALALMRASGRFPYLRQSLIAIAIIAAAGCGLVWLKSAAVGSAPVSQPMVRDLVGTVVGREAQSADARTRLLLATREPETGRPIKVRLNLPDKFDSPAVALGAVVSLRARLVPPAPPMVPGSYDFARSAWFQGLAATGSVLGPVRVQQEGTRGAGLEQLQHRLSQHIRNRLSGSAGALATALASGDRGAVADADETAMRDAGLSHLLSISGLHVSAVIAAAYFLALKLLALSPWLALRTRLPVVAAAAGALAGIGYTLLSGSEVPTIRSCIGAMLVLAAMVLGREPLSLRMLAVAAFFILLFWPESAINPGFQMSFASVIAIVALHSSAPVRSYLVPREEGWLARAGRRLVMTVLTGLVIELALMPIGLFHFNRAGVYGAMANVIAIPLTTFVSMPAIALALLCDGIGAGAPFWWLAGVSLDLLLAIARWTAAQPGAVASLPRIGQGPMLMFVAAALWLALWRGRRRLWSLPILALATAMMLRAPAPDILVTGDGRQVGLVERESGQLLLLRESRSDFVRDNLSAQAAQIGPAMTLSDWPDARCNPDFCLISLKSQARAWSVLMTRSRERVPERALAAACERVDIVLSDRWLPRSCQPRVLKADRRLLENSGGLALYLDEGRVDSVAASQGEHGWWRGGGDRPSQFNQRQPSSAQIKPDLSPGHIHAVPAAPLPRAQ